MVEKKGIVYALEAFLAAVTLFIFLSGTFDASAGQDWNKYNREVAAEDLSLVLKKTGDMEDFVKRGETGSIKTVASTLSSGKLDVSGSIENLPLGGERVGFYVNETDTLRLPTTSSLTRCSGDVEELEPSSEEPIIRTQTERHGVHLYFGDTDPRNASNFNNRQDYDTVWVDNGTTCQFSGAEGPHYPDNFFLWGNSTDSVADSHYDFKEIRDDGSFFTVFRANTAVNFSKTMDKPVNGIETDVEFDTFNFSIDSMNRYSLIVFQQGSLDDIQANSGRVKNYAKKNPMLMLMDLEKNDFSTYQFLRDTGLEWVDLGWSSKPDEIRFTDFDLSKEVETYFQAQQGDKNIISMDPGGNISSSNGESIMTEDQLVSSRSDYSTSPWNATNYSMDPISQPSGAPDSPCNDYTNGTFKFPKNNYIGVNTNLGDTSCSGVRALNIDFDRDGDFSDENEGKFVNGERVVVDNRTYTVIIYDDQRAEFFFVGDGSVEMINYRTSFRDQNIQRFARAPYENPYTEDEKKLISSVIYWLLGDTQSFGDTEGSSISTTVIGSVNKHVYMPYQAYLRWEEP